MTLLYMLDADTSAFIMRGPSENLRQKLLATSLDKQSISVVTLAELLYGVRLSSKSRQNREALGAFVRYVSVLEWTENAAEAYADIRVHLQNKGQMIGANDLMIAAHARSMGAVLVTNNEREFRRVPRLKVENWV